MAELVDALGSGPSEVFFVEVRVLFWAPNDLNFDLDLTSLTGYNTTRQEQEFMSKTYSIYETKAKLSEILRQVKAGQEIIVSERGHPIAKISSFSPKEGWEGRIEALITGGQIIKAAEKTDLEILVKRKGALETFLAERD